MRNMRTTRRRGSWAWWTGIELEEWEGKEDGGRKEDRECGWWVGLEEDDGGCEDGYDKDGRWVGGWVGGRMGRGK